MSKRRSIYYNDKITHLTDFEINNTQTEELKEEKLTCENCEKICITQNHNRCHCCNKCLDCIPELHKLKIKQKDKYQQYLKKVANDFIEERKKEEKLKKKKSLY